MIKRALAASARRPLHPKRRLRPARGQVNQLTIRQNFDLEILA
jgi:hypothetical protein